MTTLTYISSSHGDWCAIYIDDKLHVEGHSIDTWDWLWIAKLGTITETKQLEVNGEWLEGCGTFPASFKDIPEEMY